MDQRSNSEPRDRRPPTKASTYVPGLWAVGAPFMPFNTQTRTTDIMMFNSRNLGALIVDERPHVREWDEPGMGIQNVGIEESYGFGVLNEGQAIALARNIRVRSNECSGVAHSWSAWGSESACVEAAQDVAGSKPVDVIVDRFERGGLGYSGEARGSAGKTLGRSVPRRGAGCRISAQQKSIFTQ